MEVVDARIHRLEERLDDLEHEVGSVRADVSAIRTDVSWIKRALQSNGNSPTDREKDGVVPSTMYMRVIVGLLIVVLALLGIVGLTGGDLPILPL